MKIGIISDLHEDIIRTKEAIKLLKNSGCKKIVCLGDFLGYSVPYFGYLKSRSGSGVISLLQENCDIVLAGDHDLFSIKKLPKYNSGFKYPKNRYKLDFSTRVKLADKKLRLCEDDGLSSLITEEEKKYVDILPEFVIEEIDGMKILFSHWIYPDLPGATRWKAIEKDDYKKLFSFMKKNNCIINIVGHAHPKNYYFSEDGFIDMEFNKKIHIDKMPCGFSVPCVANGTFPNGVAIFDTKTMDVEFLPLNTPVHIVPERAKL